MPPSADRASTSTLLPDHLGNVHSTPAQNTKANQNQKDRGEPETPRTAHSDTLKRSHITEKRNLRTLKYSITKPYLNERKIPTKNHVVEKAIRFNKHRTTDPCKKTPEVN